MWVCSLDQEDPLEEGMATHSSIIACSLSVSSIHGSLQARILDWVALSFSRGSSQAKD